MKTCLLLLCFLFSSLLIADEHEHCAVLGLGVGVAVLAAGVTVSGLDYPAEFSITNWKKFSNFVHVGLKKTLYYTLSVGSAALSVAVGSNICMKMMEIESPAISTR